MNEWRKHGRGLAMSKLKYHARDKCKDRMNVPPDPVSQLKFGQEFHILAVQ